MNELEQRIRDLTRPLNGQYPRPWMTDLTEPERARVFIVGRNQATGFPTTAVAPDDYYDALFNRNGRSCRRLYEEIRSGQGEGPSPTRRNTDSLVDRLRARGVASILETNVICYSTPMSAHLADARHHGGTERGTLIFRTLLDIVQPEVLIAHGAGTAKDLARVLGVPLPSPPTSSADPVPERGWRGRGDAGSVLVLPALSPPAWNRWSRWAPPYLDAAADRVAALLARP